MCAGKDELKLLTLNMYLWNIVITARYRANKIKAIALHCSQFQSWNSIFTVIMLSIAYGAMILFHAKLLPSLSVLFNTYLMIDLTSKLSLTMSVLLFLSLSENKC